MEDNSMKTSDFFENISAYQAKIRRILDQANEHHLLSERESEIFFNLYGLKGNRFKSLNELRREQGLTTSGIQKKLMIYGKNFHAFRKRRICADVFLISYAPCLIVFAINQNYNHRRGGFFQINQVFMEENIFDNHVILCYNNS